jgi:hypothetical protein
MGYMAYLDLGADKCHNGEAEGTLSPRYEMMREGVIRFLLLGPRR